MASSCHGCRAVEVEARLGELLDEAAQLGGRRGSPGIHRPRGYGEPGPFAVGRPGGGAGQRVSTGMGWSVSASASTSASWRARRRGRLGLGLVADQDPAADGPDLGDEQADQRAGEDHDRRRTPGPSARRW